MTEAEFIQALQDGKTLVATRDGSVQTIAPITSEWSGRAFHFHSSAPQDWDRDFVTSSALQVLKLLPHTRVPLDGWRVMGEDG